LVLAREGLENPDHFRVNCDHVARSEDHVRVNILAAGPFVVSANKLRTPRHKGKVESSVKYVKRNFIAGEDLGNLDLARLNEKGRKWALKVAGIRDHGTIHYTLGLVSFLLYSSVSTCEIITSLI